MNSLQELNNFGSTIVDFLDSRVSGVVFDRQYPLTAVDQEITISSITVEPEVGINIEEIINYQTADVRYRVTIQTGAVTPLTGSSISWASLPSGATLTQVGDVYTISGIHSVADWEAVKNFTWTLPVAYASYPLWYLTVEIVYYDSDLAEDVIMDWVVYDDRFYWVAQLEGTATMSVIGGRESPAETILSAAASVTAELYLSVLFDSTMSADATVTCEGRVNVDYLTATASMTVEGKLDAIGVLTMSAAASMTTNGLAIAVNLDARTYLANTGNQIFATNTPQIDTPTPATDTISIALSSALGQFAATSTDNPVSTLTISGTKATVNSALLNVHFYPTAGSSTSGTFTWQQSLNSVVQFTKTISMTGFANSFAETTLTFNSTQSWTPTVSQVVYGLADLLLVGGGGGGAYGGGGGGGGVRYLTNLSLSNSAYTLTVGDGGTAGDATPGSIPYSVNGGSGGNTSALGYTANGGTGGKNTTTVVSGTTYADWSGGASGSPTSYAGGARSGVRSAPFNIGGGGGGAGAVGQVPDLTLPGYYGGNGGNGITNSITGTATYYGGGGGGNVAEQIAGSTFQGMGGLGGGGDGADYFGKLSTYQHQSDGVDGLGGGGGGGSSNSTTSYFQIGRGGKGVVIVKIHA